MQFSEKWLRSFVDPEIDTAALSHLLTMAGLEVEELDPAAAAFTGVVVAEVLSVAPHPDADRLPVCQVNAGGEPLQIVCGAPNVAAGMKVPCAIVGAKLPGIDIKRAKLRGVESSGMLCSARELGISEEASGLLALPADAPVGTSIREYLDLDDNVFVIKLTPNRADCFGMTGIAREVAALTGAPLSLPTVASAPVSIADVLPVKVEHADLCGRFSGRVIRGVNARAATPDWMKRRLERAGMRSISVLVDISNYVMLEMNRPNHVFDLDRVQGGLHVRWAKAGEKLVLLNEQTIELTTDCGVIADDAGVESFAGIMGGASTSCTDDTRNVYVEAAFWLPDAIQGRARRYAFSSEAAHRFERGVDFADTVAGVERVSQLILELCGGQAGPVDDQITALPSRDPVRLRPARAARVLGIRFRDDQIAATINQILTEDMLDTPGKGRIIKIKTEEVVIEIIRYILKNKLFVEQLVTNSTYFKDPRLIDIFAYIKDNLGGDLSNKVLANVANVSEDYVGQYFKMLTGINPQDYIEYQRMEKAVDLLRTSKKSIRAIGSDVGYKDTAYFCRRFKMMFGIPAGKMRRRESLMNV